MLIILVLADTGSDLDSDSDLDLEAVVEERGARLMTYFDAHCMHGQVPGRIRISGHLAAP